MQDSVIQQIKDKLDIVDVVGSYLKLQKTGINLRAPCPFHSEKKPSFFVSPARQSFKCFGCGEQGSIFDFVMKIEGIEFGDALKILAQRAGVELKSLRPELKTERQRLYEICELASKFFEKQLASSAGREVKKYLLKRGLTKDSIRKWRLGYAPGPGLKKTGSWRNLSDFLVGKGYSREEIVKAGLAVVPEKGGTPYDRFRQRIIFPVFDFNSQVIGFGGRVLEGSEETAKYINTPNTLLYDKSRVVYGLNFAKVEVRKKDFSILTEGYTDAILVHQAGFANAVASSGTALTPFHLRILKRYSNKLLLALDMDVAGDMATKKGIDLAQKEGFEIKVIEIPQGKDPAEFIAKNPKKWQKLVETARDIMTFYFENALTKFDSKTPQGKKEISQLLLPRLKDIANKIVQAHWVQKLADSLGVSEKIIYEEMAKISRSEETLVSAEQEISPAEKAEETKTRKQILEERIIFLLLKEPEHLESVQKDFLQFFSPETKTIISGLKKDDLSAEKNLTKALEKFEKKGENIKKVLDDVFLMSEISDFGIEAGEASEEMKEEIELCLEELKKIGLKSELIELGKEISEAEKEGDQKKLKKLVEEFNKKTKELKQFF